MIIHVCPKFAKRMFPHMTEKCATECCRELLAIHYKQKK